MSRKCVESVDVNKFILQYELETKDNLRRYIKNNPENLDIATLMRITELCNAKREENAAFYTNKFIENFIVLREIFLLNQSMSIKQAYFSTGC